VSRVNKRVCDRCGKETVFAENDEGWQEAPEFPVPSGHVTRTDVIARANIDLCKECHLSMRRWWMSRDGQEK
jgi:hypothetical protein